MQQLSKLLFIFKQTGLVARVSDHHKCVLLERNKLEARTRDRFYEKYTDRHTHERCNLTPHKNFN